MLRYSLAVLGLIAALIVLRWPGAGGTELLPNGGFESGTDPWIAFDGVLDTVASPVHGGAAAGRLSGTLVQTHEVRQFLDAQSGASYTFGGWAYLDDAGAASVSLRISWFASNGDFISQDSSAFLSIHKPEYQSISTGSRTAPVGATRARLDVVVQVSAPFTVYLDDLSLDGPAPTPTPAPTAAPATDTPSPSPSAAPTPTATATPSASPTPLPTATQSTSPTAVPSATAVPTPTRSPAPSRTPTPTPSPTVPTAFADLTNGSFEDVDGDGLPFGWRKFGGEMTTTAAQHTDGLRALEFRSRTASTKWAYQTVLVTGGEYYSALADALPGDGVEAAFLRISWYASEDGSGSSLGSTDSPLATADPAFTRLDTGAVQAPDKAMTARIRLMMRPESDAPATAYFDDVEFGPAVASTPTLTPSPAASPSPTPMATASPPQTPTPSAAPTLTASPVPTPTPPAAQEPEVFPTLTNAGFENPGVDGAPYGWRKVGGEISVVAEPRSEGSRALRFASATTSTKWVYQTVTIDPGAYYEASVQALKDDPGTEALFLRLSWYAAEDGEGAAIDSVDSTDLLDADSPAFRSLSTGPVQSPSEARSVRVKLMLRPVSASVSAAYFDDVRLSRVPAPPGTPAGLPPGTVLAVARGSGSVTGAASATPAVLGAVSTPVVPANVRARATPVPGPVPAPDSGPDGLTYAAMSVALAALGLAGFSEWRRRVERRA